MPRNILTSRFEAEEIVELIDAHSKDGRMIDFAAELRLEFGMITKDQEAEVRKQQTDNLALTDYSYGKTQQFDSESEMHESITGHKSKHIN